MALRRQPNRAEVQYLLAVAKRRSGRLAEFLPHLRRAAELGWDPQDIERQTWLAAAQRGDLADVQRQLFEAVQAESSNEAAEEIYEAFAKGCLTTYRIADASMCVDFWLQWRPDAPQARIMRASVYEQLSDWERACGDYRAVLADRPDHRFARIRLGQALLVRKQYDEAHAEFQAQLAVTPDDADALLGAAQAARRLGNASEAREHLETALPLALSAQQRGSVLGELGRLLLSDGKAREALEPLTQAAAMLPGDYQIRHALGTAHARVGNRAEAEHHHAKMQHLRTQHARLMEVTRRLTTEQANADLRCEAGGILMDVGMKKEGADWLLTAVQYDPAHRRSHELLAGYYAESGNQTLAGRHRLLAAQAPPPRPAEPKSKEPGAAGRTPSSPHAPRP
jgi:Tfp pilus assembly protein PilF